MLKIFKYLRAKDWMFLGFCVIFIVTQVWLDLKLPDYMNEITKIIKNSGKMSKIWEQGGWMLLCALGSAAGAIFTGYFAARVAAGFSRRVRALIFDKVGEYSMGEINKFSTPSLITRSTNDIMQTQFFMTMGIQVLIKAPITAVWAITKIVGKGWQWSAATGIAVSVLAVVLLTLMFLVFPKFRRVQTLLDNLNSVTREGLMGIRVVRAYNAEAFQETKFDKANTELTDTNRFVHRSMAVMNPVMMAINSGLALSIYCIGAYLINSAVGAAKIDVFADMMVFTAYAMQVVMSFMMLTMLFIMLPRFAVSAKRINEVLDTKVDIKEGNGVGVNNSGEIEFKNVSFKYPGAKDYVISDINLKIKNGETVAFIGSTGSGKSTLINLVPRFYDVTGGELLIGGHNVKDYKLEELYNIIGYVPQRAVLFSGSIKSNVAFGESAEEITDETVKEALEIAQGAEFVDKLEQKENSEVARGGTNLSGGQKQRVAIARAIARKPKIYVFDDSFSALDYKTDRTLRKALKSQTKNVTTLIVAQRIGTIMDADKIVVLENGKTAGIGTHKELLQKCEVYKEIAFSQLSREELGL